MTKQQGWADLYAFRVDRTDDAPLFRQIYAQMRAAILSRALRAGAKLPSTRELAMRLAVSRTAVSPPTRDLEQDELVVVGLVVDVAD
jgi:GntR family transcriptional regulator/MocR family aminotransferase